VVACQSRVIAFNKKPGKYPGFFLMAHQANSGSGEERSTSAATEELVRQTAMLSEHSD